MPFALKNKTRNKTNNRPFVKSAGVIVALGVFTGWLSANPGLATPQTVLVFMCFIAAVVFAKLSRVLALSLTVPALMVSIMSLACYLPLLAGVPGVYVWGGASTTMAPGAAIVGIINGCALTSIFSQR